MLIFCSLRIKVWSYKSMKSLRSNPINIILPLSNYNSLHKTQLGKISWVKEHLSCSLYIWVWKPPLKGQILITELITKTHFSCVFQNVLREATPWNIVLGLYNAELGFHPSLLMDQVNWFIWTPSLLHLDLLKTIGSKINQLSYCNWIPLSQLTEIKWAAKVST